ncbi:MAG: transposase [Bacteroidales bacterium]|nr:transposase [Bacteroidales bacterium]
MNDATAYESYIKYPTDIKLLWDSVSWVFETMHAVYKKLGLTRPRSKYREQQVNQMVYSKKRRKTYKMIRVRKRALLYLLNKGINLLDEGIDQLMKESPTLQVLFEIQPKLLIVKEIYRQQNYMFENNTKKIKDRIVSLFKPYLRPIVRGKERNNAEFGAKAVISQVDGINLIDKLSFDPFNEAKELRNSIEKHKERFGALKEIGIDRIYGTNENRKYMKEQGISHSLVRKGKPGKDEKQKKELRRKLGKERSTVLEGSFGNEKNHYGLRKVKARNEFTEIIWIFFGIMTANAVKISKRRSLKRKKINNEPQQLKIAS